MILQPFITKEISEQNIDALYYHVPEKKEITSLPIMLQKGMKISTNTYMNSFSIEKWQRYCVLQKLFLHIFVSGKLKVKVINAYLNENAVIQEEEIFSTRIDEKDRTELAVPISEIEKGIIYYSMEALTDECIFYDAYYEEKTPPIHNIHIAINICTYKREQYLLHNLDLLKEKILENEKSDLYKHVKVYIVDNGQTLQEIVKTNDDIFLYNNKNVGGAGGFTRGLLEIENGADKLGLTHVIFMDDDIELNCEAVRRTFAVLSYLSDEYSDAFIAGALLDRNRKWMQQENGALWNQGNCVHIYDELDMTHFYNVVRNEEEVKRDYAAWWYCCMNLQSISSNDNLPIPIFLHVDDVEYSLRNASKIITMNGISVWHPTSEHRRIATNEYYNLRNTLIVNALYCEGISCNTVKKNVIKSILAAFLRMRYAVMELLVKAIEDFCKGPEWLLSIDGMEYHQVLLERGEKLVDVSKYLNQGDRKAFFMNVYPLELLWVNRAILYDETDKKGIIVRRDWKKCFYFFSCVRKVCKLLNKQYMTAQEQYRIRRTELQSEEIWRKILDL